MSQKKEDFIRGCENALRFYGGTPAAIVPDNLKSAVTRYGKYESELNEDFYQNNGYVRLDKSFYSVPTKYIGRKMSSLWKTGTAVRQA